MTQPRILVAALAVSIVMFPALSKADINIYTFDANPPDFFPGQTTPISNAAPNIGDPGFLTNFAQAADPGGATIIPGGFPSPLFDGGFLVTGAPGAITLTFNKPINTLSVDFGLDADISDSGAFLELVTPSGTLDQFNTVPASPFAGGLLLFSSATPFTSASLNGFSSTGSQTLFAIDNLTLTQGVTPEPSFLVPVGAGLAGLACFAAFRRRRRQA